MKTRQTETERRERGLPDEDGDSQLSDGARDMLACHDGVVPVATSARFIVVVVDKNSTTNSDV